MEKLKMNNFANVIECLNRGGHAKRMAWQGNRKIVKQLPQCISKDIVPRMTSLPDSIKPVIGTVGSGSGGEFSDILFACVTVF